MLKSFSLHLPEKKQVIAFVATVIAASAGGLAVNYLPSYWITVVFGVFGLFLTLSRPALGLYVLIFVLYFPIFPSVPLGPLEFSASTLLVVGLTISALFQIRGSTRKPLLAWQWMVLLALSAVFGVSIFFSIDPAASLRFSPNLAIYILILFSMMILVDTPKKLWSLARFIIVLDFVLSIWRIELAPLRHLFDLPSFGINGAVFAFHPGVALIMVFMAFPALSKLISAPWKWFNLIALISLIVHAVILQSRSAWLAWIILAMLIFLHTGGRGRVAIVGFALVVALMLGLFYRDTISHNLSQTQTTVGAWFSDKQTGVDSGDLIRLYAREAGWRMFLERPVFGWGPDQFNVLKPSFITVRTKESLYPGAFNAWLIYLTEMGAVTVAVVLVIFLTPLIASLRWLRSRREDAMLILAYGFALGTLAIGIHLFFIDLFYSFAWTQVGLSLTAMRMAQANDILALEK